MAGGDPKGGGLGPQPPPATLPEKSQLSSFNDLDRQTAVCPHIAAKRIFRALANLGVPATRTPGSATLGKPMSGFQIDPRVLGAENERARGLIVECASYIPVEPVEWLWPHRIAVGKLTLIAGEAGWESRKSRSRWLPLSPGVRGGRAARGVHHSATSSFSVRRIVRPIRSCRDSWLPAPIFSACILFVLSKLATAKRPARSVSNPTLIYLQARSQSSAMFDWWL